MAVERTLHVINTVLEQAGKHYVTIVLRARVTGGELSVRSSAASCCVAFVCCGLVFTAVCLWGRSEPRAGEVRRLELAAVAGHLRAAR